MTGLGLFGAVELGTRALQTQRQGVEVTGQNMANVNNPAYARQRVVVQTSLSLQSRIGTQGTGVEAVRISQLRDALTDRQIRTETSVSGYLSGLQSGLEQAQSSLGQLLGAQASGSSGASIASQLSAFFGAFQSLANDPNSLASREAALSSAQQLASRLNEVSNRLTDTAAGLDEAMTADVKGANALLEEIASMNRQISQAEFGDAKANDLRDKRQATLESLAGLVNFDTAENPDGTVNVSIGGNLLVTGDAVSDRLETYDAGAGQMLLRTSVTKASVDLTGGRVQGAITARDVGVGGLRQDLDALAANLATEVNALHSVGFDLAGNTGAPLFTGNTAGGLRVNPALVGDPRKLQASSVAGSSGDNQVALGIARLADTPIGALGDKTLAQQFSGSVARIGQFLNETKGQAENQDIVEKMLSNQRESLSGVSLDEEMTNLVKYQKAYEASARLISILSEMIDNVLNLGR